MPMLDDLRFSAASDLADRCSDKLEYLLDQDSNRSGLFELAGNWCDTFSCS